MSNPQKTVGIIGAGKVAIVLAQLATKAGYAVLVSGSGNPEKITLTVSVLAPGATALTSGEVASRADVIILAIPLGRYKELPKEALKNKLVLDAMNYWWEVDGNRPDLVDPNTSSSEVVQTFLSGSRVVKAFNHIGYHDLYDETRPQGSPDRKAIAVAGDNESDLAETALLVNELGFDPVMTGNLASGRKLQPGSPVFGAHINAKQLQNAISKIK